MTDDARQGFESDFSLADACVTILVGGADVEAVVEMDGMEAGEADYTVEFFKYAVEIVCDIISRIPNVTGIETDAEPFLAVYALDDGGDFLEAAPDLRSFARHGLQEHDRLLRRIEDIVQKVCDKFDAFFCALLYMTAGVKIVERVRDMLEAC